MNYNEALKYSMDLCSKQEKCKRDISEKLSCFKVPAAEIEKVLEVLVRENFINEKRFAGYFCRDKLRFNRWGKVKIRFMLRQKGISSGITEEALDAINQADYLEILRDELLKKRGTLKGNNAYELRGKLFRFAQQRGFETGLIHQILDEFL